MLKKIKKFIFTSGVALISFSLASCGGGTPATKNKYKVIFNPNYEGATNFTQEVYQGEKVKEPETPPTREYYTFEGWCTDKEGKDKFNFSTKITASIMLYGSWKTEQYNVTYDPNYGSEQVIVKKVDRGSCAENLKVSRPNYTFLGWYLDKDCSEGKEFDFATPIMDNNTKLYAKWEQVMYKITFVPNYDSEPSFDVDVGSGSTVEEPETPAREGYVFNGWRVTKDASSNKFDFDSIIYSSKTLYGSYTKIETQPTLKNLPLYNINSYGVISDASANVNTYFFNDNDIAYFPVSFGIDQYLNLYPYYYPSLFNYYTYTTSNFKTTITNGTNSSTCVIDYKKQTMTFKDYSAFLAMDKNQKTPIDNGFTGGRDYFYSITKKNYYAPSEPLVIDFRHYNIPLFYYNNEGYLPLQIFNNILCEYCLLNITYAADKLFSGSASSEYQLTANEELKNTYNFKGFSKDYLEYCYNLNAMTINTRYGMNKRLSRADGKTLVYEQDAYNVMKKYRKEFMSTSRDTANHAFSKVLNLNYDDGGHTGYSSYGFYDYNQYEFDTSTEIYSTLLANFRLSISRPDEYDAIIKYKNNYAVGFSETLNYKTNDTLFFTFDSFTDNGSIPTYSNVTETNSFYSVIGLVKYTDKLIRSNSNIKKLVIDLSVNTGGTVFDQFYISSWLCGGCTALTANPRTKALSEVTYKADINDDGMFDSNDKLPSNIQDVYVIISPSSFSCGNLLPTTLEDYCSKVHFIGSRSGGGACYVQSGLQTGYGSTYQCSSTIASVRKGSTQSNLILNDDGVSNIDYPIDMANPSDYYNRNAIYDMIH